MLRVSGEVDLATIDLLRAALDALLDQRPHHLIVDLSQLSFCDGEGLDELVTAGCTAARVGIGYAISAPSAQADRLWSTVWPAAEVPIRYPNAAAAVLAAMAGSTSPGPDPDPHPKDIVITRQAHNLGSPA